MSVSDILLMASNLSEGQTIREECPYCRGGDNGEKSLSITVLDGAILWNCFRAKCGEAGARGGRHLPTQTVARIHKEWGGDTHSLPIKVQQRIKELWGIVDPPHWWWTTDFGGRVAMSVRSPKDIHRGWVLRDITGGQRTKALTYIDKGEGLSWYKTTPFAPTVLVEDIPSAIRASAYVNTVALLGTGIGLSRATEIADNATRPIIIALDQDATRESFRWARKWTLLWGDCTVLPLSADLKDLEQAQLREVLSQWISGGKRY